jgi:small nuclear ribonucleoprotein (snRNP)-like protein
MTMKEDLFGKLLYVKLNNNTEFVGRINNVDGNFIKCEVTESRNLSHGYIWINLNNVISIQERRT